MEEEYPDELVDDEENNGSVAEEVLLDDKGEDPLGEKGELNSFNSDFRYNDC